MSLTAEPLNAWGLTAADITIVPTVPSNPGQLEAWLPLDPGRWDNRKPESWPKLFIQLGDRALAVLGRGHSHARIAGMSHMATYK